MSYGLHLMKNPAGSYSFVGSVPVFLGYKEKDGSPLTQETAAKLAHISSPALIAKSRVYQTPAEALQAADEIGVNVANRDLF